ncbi:MAG: carboxypeptidase-like regulatory domain-containing protein [Vicinamibacteria bacterium]|nr:carboxypeptidase-like regulatory domain-containing protein [Vicinamibacteria bacterium]
MNHTGGPREADEEPRVFKIAKLGGRRGFVETLAKGAAAGTATIAAGSCGGGGSSGTAPSPVATTTTAQQTWTLQGYVTDSSTGRPVAGATVTILDGPNSGRSTTTDGNGYFVLPNLTQSGFTIRVCAPTHDCANRAVTLTSSLQIDVRLTATTSTTTARSTSSRSSSTTTSGGGSHYWFPC